MRTSGSAAVQGFTGTRGGVAPPSGVDLPERWVLQRRSGSRSMTEHGLASTSSTQKPLAEDSSALRRRPNPVQLLI